MKFPKISKVIESTKTEELQSKVIFQKRNVKQKHSVNRKESCLLTSKLFKQFQTDRAYMKKLRDNFLSRLDSSSHQHFCFYKQLSLFHLIGRLVGRSSQQPAAVLLKCLKQIDIINLYYYFYTKCIYLVMNFPYTKRQQSDIANRPTDTDKVHQILPQGISIGFLYTFLSMFFFLLVLVFIFSDLN